MKILALAGALTLAGGLGLAAPAYAGYYDVDGVYHTTVDDYTKSAPDYYPTYRAPTYRSYGELSRSEIRRSLRNQGYYDISDLHREGYSENHQQPDRGRQHEQRAPAEQRRQLAADRRGKHRSQHIRGCEIGDYLRNAVLAVDVARDSARQHDAAACSRSL